MILCSSYSQKKKLFNFLLFEINDSSSFFILFSLLHFHAFRPEILRIITTNLISQIEKLVLFSDYDPSSIHYTRYDLYIACLVVVVVMSDSVLHNNKTNAKSKKGTHKKD